MNFRVAVPKDLTEVWEVYTTAVKAMNQRGSDQWGDFYPTYELIKNDIRIGTLLLLEVDDNIVAVGVMDQNGAPEYNTVNWVYDSPFTYIHRIAVHSAHQGKGLSRHFMNNAHKYAVSKGYKTMRLDTREDNIPALGLYTSLGYIKRGQVKFDHEAKKVFPCMEIDLTVL